MKLVLLAVMLALVGCASTIPKWLLLCVPVHSATSGRLATVCKPLDPDDLEVAPNEHPKEPGKDNLS
jgi:hypothetical protein